MAKEISERKKYIREAKTRLQDNYYNIFGEDTYYLNNKKLNGYQISELKRKIAQVVACDEFVPNPLGRLIEEDVFEKLDQAGKTKYIFDLSEIYLKMREKVQ